MSSGKHVCKIYTHLNPTIIYNVGKLGFTGVKFFINFDPKHRLWVLIRSASVMHFLRVHTIHVLSKNVKNIKVFRMKFLLLKKSLYYMDMFL